MTFFETAFAENFYEEIPYFCALAGMTTVGIKAYCEMQKYYYSPKEILTSSDSSRRATGIFSENQLREFNNFCGRNSPEALYETVQLKGAKFCSCEAPDYPSRLKELADKPLGLFFYGELPPDDLPAVGVIGARECSFYGEEVSTIIGEILGIYKIPVISGMARGIDSMSQLGALEKGGKSYGILGNGPDICYPRESRKLYEKLKELGGIISEYPPGRDANKTTFVRRNRIIAGLSDAICVVEAKKKSGTLTTVDFALEQGRDVYAVPGRVTDKTSYGCNELIRQGAEIVSDPEEFAKDIISKYASVSEPGKTNINIEEKISFDEMSYLERKILCSIREDEFTVSELFSAEDMKGYCGSSEAVTTCMNLSFLGLLSDLGAGRFRLTSKGRKCRDGIKSMENEEKDL